MSVLALAGLAPFLPAQAVEAGTSDAFRKFASQVFKVQVVEKSSGAKSSFGSAFLVGSNGRMITNYHVVANVVNIPARYRAELIDTTGATSAVKVLAVDVVHDLAVVETDMRNRPFFPIAPAAVSQGDRLFSLGNPRDLGLSIVEGTYNGLLSHTLYARIHLTASINPGMSGGPTINGKGNVIGVNVATGGDQLGFLVPVDRVINLLDRVNSSPADSIAPTPAVLGQQLRAYQDVYLKNMFDSNTTTMEFGPYRVPTQPAPFFRCWGDRMTPRERTYEGSFHRCQTDGDIFLGEDQYTGSLEVNHELYRSTKLNGSQFYSLLTQRYRDDGAPYGDAEFVTNWKCTSQNVRHRELTMQVSQCFRRYKTLGELYDTYVKVATLGRSNVGIVSTLSITGATFENATRATQRFLEHITWR